MQKRRGFSIIELLISGAIIALLCLVAVPSFRDAQSRTRVAQVKDDLRRISVALEGYYSEWRIYPYDGANATTSYRHFGYWQLPYILSTPVAYLETVRIRDPFRKQRLDVASPGMWQMNDYRYICTESSWGSSYDFYQGATPSVSQYYINILTEFGEYRVQSSGPDGAYGPSGWIGLAYYGTGQSFPIPFDPTNGLVSNGDIIRSQRFVQGYGNIPEN